ncbi:MAG: hypothetical protein FWD53_13090 [Phycisphaerales bacterium]|nr:hypothetical protein [Phycisphaerales bacterium]
MDKRYIVTVVCSALGLINANEFAQAETVGRYECSVVGPVSQEPIGDKDGHRLISIQYSCFGVEGLVKGALYSGTATNEWDGPQATYLFGGGITRAAGGLAVAQVTEGASGPVVMEEGKPVGNEFSGKGVFKFASGTLAALSGKAVRWETKPAGFGRFTLEIRTDEEAGAIRTSKE